MDGELETSTSTTGDGSDSTPTIDRPIVVAANRLPVMRTDDGWAPSPGGLVRALYPMLRESGGTWVGWTGDTDDAAEPFTVEGVDLHPIAISADELELYYEGFSNDALWPLYHDALRESTYDVEQWEAYHAVNERFAVSLGNIAPLDSVVWIHDYQLQLVPEMLRAARPDLTIGFFLHIPFPPAELFSRLPWREEVIRGLLGCDLIGFQRPKDASNFSAAAEQLLSAEIDGDIIKLDGALSSTGVFPISIDVDEVEEIASARSTRQRTSQIRARLGDPEVVMLGVDRLDYTKGIGLRLRAFAQLLEDGRLDPSLHVMVQIATPTREAVEHYQDERASIERLVGEINGRFSRLGLPVVHYLYQTLPYDELVALYRAGDVMLVTPFRDGMNLVAKEYCAANIDGDGVLVLSEFAGAADELTQAVQVNPHDDRALQDAIVEAVEMRRRERRPRMAGLRDQIQKSDVQGWADRFLAALSAKGVAHDDPADVAAAISQLDRPTLIVFDCDGVLAPLTDHADDSVLTQGVGRRLTDLSRIDGIDVAVLSGRSLDGLAQFEFDESITISGSYGGERRGRQLAPLSASETELLAAADEIVSDAAALAGEGAWVERKPTSVVLHVREAEAARGDQAIALVRERQQELNGHECHDGSMVVEIMARPADKGLGLDDLRSDFSPAAVVYFGDDVPDEDAFARLQESDLGVKVGRGATIATHRLQDPDAVNSLLHDLINALR